MDKDKAKKNLLNNTLQTFTTISQKVIEYEKNIVDPSQYLAKNKLSSRNKNNILSNNAIDLEDMEFITSKANTESKPENMLEALKSDINYLESIQDNQRNPGKYFLRDNPELYLKLNISEIIQQCSTISITKIEEIELLKAEIEKNYK